ncbi:MAG: OmpA family protein [Thermodesulfobacteriota bacterium]
MRIGFVLALFVFVLTFAALAGCAKTGEKKRDGHVPRAGKEGDKYLKEDALHELKGRLEEGRLGLVDIFFDYDKSNIRSDERPVLNKNANIMRESSVILVVVEGYCDTRGTEEYNLALGQRRADAVKAYLLGLGVSPGLVTAVSRGETDRFEPGASKRSFQENRRAHFVTAE